MSSTEETKPNSAKASIHLEHTNYYYYYYYYYDYYYYYYYYYYYIQRPFSRTTWASRYQKGKPFWIVVEQQMTGDKMNTKN